jgi:ribosomal protein S18 acetylase RimI-like enzyme
MNSELVIRKAQAGDAAVLKKISVDTFVETFASQNTKEDMDLFLKECFNLETIQKEISDKDTEYHMAFLDNKLAGYVKFRRDSHEDLKNNKCIEISRIYVYEAFQSKKIGSALMRFVIDQAKAAGMEIIWLGVWEFNPKAIQFYEKWGFKVFGKHVFRLGTDDQNDLLMCKHL